jgi:hypothetical protein
MSNPTPPLPPPSVPPRPASTSPLNYSDPTSLDAERWATPRVLKAYLPAFILLLVLQVGLTMIVPKYDSVFTDFRLDLPGISALLIRVSRLYRGLHLWTIAPPVFLTIPLAWLPFSNPRRRSRLFPMLFWLAAALCILWFLLGLGLPMTALNDHLAAPPSKHQPVR